MTEFLSPAWIDALNATLAEAGAVPGEPRTVVLDLVGSPDGTVVHLSVALGPDGARAEVADHDDPAARLSLTYDDARAVHEGRLSSADALVEGQVKVRGDVGALVTALDWLLGVTRDDD